MKFYTKISIFLLLSSQIMAHEHKSSLIHFDQLHTNDTYNEKSFVIFDLDETKSKIDLFDQIKINGKKNILWEQNAFSQKDLQQYFIDQGNNEELAQKATDNLYDIMTNAMQKCIPKLQKSAYTIVLRAENEKYDDNTDWHIDGRAPCSQNYIQYRMIIPLRGQGTLFTELTPEQRNIFNYLFCKNNKYGKASAENEQAINQFIEPLPKQQIEQGQAVLFLLCNKDKGAVHRRPNTTEERLFLFFSFSKKIEE